MKIIESLKSRMNKIDRNKSIVFSFPILFFLLITFIVVLADPVPTRSVEITSNYSGEGSWTINKSAEWISANKARISLELNSQMKSTGRNKDIILVMDISGSMSGDKLSKAKEDAKDLVSTLLTDSNNRIALITFESSASKLSDLTNDSLTLNNLIDGLSVSGNTNYNSGLVEAKNIIDNYTLVNNKDLIVLFLTDGIPNEEIPNQVSTYQIIKEQYPYVRINAIQYEMGTDIIQAIIEISDNQYIASMETLNNVLFEASFEPDYFENFKVEDYISENFEIESIGNISSTKGTVNLSIENGLQKVVWNLGNNYRTGNIETLTIDVLLKEEKHNLDQLFDTNDHEVIVSKLYSESERTVNSELTPILAGKYTVIYDTNTPTGCTLSNIPSERHFPYEIVNIRTQELSCNNYIFRGYEIEDLDVKKINSDSFIMPGHDVTIRVLWSKIDISQKMDGEVATALDFYKIIKNEYKSNSGYAKLYTGSHQDSFTREATKDIYYYTTQSDNTTQGNILIDKINVIFAGFCWQMIRTTDTGGVKMIYNGIPVDGKCLNTRSNVNSLSQGVISTTSLNASYAYGSDYTYDINAGTFKIAGTIKENIDYSSDKSVIGYYTCKNADKDATCTTLYYLEAESSTNTSPFVHPITIASTNYASIVSSIYNGRRNSLTYVGYMYGKVYETKYINSSAKEFYGSTTNVVTSNSMSTSYYYSDSVDFGNNVANKYTLVNPYRVTSSSNYPSLVGKYTFRSSSQTNSSTSVYYIVSVSGSTMYAVSLQAGKLLPDNMLLGDSITDIGNSTYEINNPVSVSPSDWLSNYNSYVGKFFCENANTTCNLPIYIAATTNSSYTGINVRDELLIAKSRSGLELTDTLVVPKYLLSKNKDNYSSYKYTCNSLSSTCTESSLRKIEYYYKDYYSYIPNNYFAESVTWTGTKYVLNNTLEIEDASNLSYLSTHHYFCVDLGLKDCTSVGYLYYYSSEIQYILLENGVDTIEEALEEMLSNNVTESKVKKIIEKWYENNLLTYDSFLEETVYCSDRRINDYAGWKSESESLYGGSNNRLHFKSAFYTTDLNCYNNKDKFSVTNNDAKLNYKIGLLSSPEIYLLNSTIVRKTNVDYYLISPVDYSLDEYSQASIEYVSASGYPSTGTVSTKYGIRPAISLASGVVPASGTGTMNDPYVVDETVIPSN